MIDAADPQIEPLFLQLKRRVEAHGVQDWLTEKAASPSRDALIYLCKFGFFTAILTKAEIAEILQMDRAELRATVKSWYDDHRARGCGTC